VLSEADVIRDRVLPDVRGSMLPPDTSHTDGALETVAAVMTPRAITVTADADVAEAADLMLSTGVKSLPVLDEQRRVVGIVSRRDIVRALAARTVTLSVSSPRCSETWGGVGWRRRTRGR